MRIALSSAAVPVRWTCTGCGGSGKRNKGKCSECKGEGQLEGTVSLPELARLLHVAATAGGEVDAEVETT